ncbi:hypothetical protein NEOLEDRAFT_942548 [Neolentinus lepideus HHB14362 ss-1]|uniref:Uncharacterized protein n=1 Tax=Neolentinus lepideus HHB14362 ss-1 TaxID=1314782 RepID=A0A165NFN8_9AGAM|nr:hypothetical protein NEOLEDRAFT_942548 [Neolentinus lepideus HHB14362 ss-1]
MSTSMVVDSVRPKLDVDEYLTTALSATPQELHPFFESFKSLHSRKYALGFGFASGGAVWDSAENMILQRDLAETMILHWALCVEAHTLHDLRHFPSSLKDNSTDTGGLIRLADYGTNLPSNSSHSSTTRSQSRTA